MSEFQEEINLYKKECQKLKQISEISVQILMLNNKQKRNQKLKHLINIVSVQNSDSKSSYREMFQNLSHLENQYNMKNEEFQIIDSAKLQSSLSEGESNQEKIKIISSQNDSISKLKNIKKKKDKLEMNKKIEELQSLVNQQEEQNSIYKFQLEKIQTENQILIQKIEKQKLDFEQTNISQQEIIQSKQKNIENLDYQINQLKKQIQDNSQTTQQNYQIAPQQNTEVEDLLKQHQQFKFQIEQYKQELDQKDQIIQKDDKLLKEQTIQLEIEKQKMLNFQHRISFLEENLTNYEKNNQILRNEINEVQNKLIQHNNQYISLQDQLRQLNQQSNNKQLEIDLLNSKLSKMQEDQKVQTDDSIKKKLNLEVQKSTDVTKISNEFHNQKLIDEIEQLKIRLQQNDFESLEDRSDIISRISNVLLTQKSIRTNHNFRRSPTRDFRKNFQQSTDKREINIIQEDVENEIENANPTLIQQDIQNLVKKEKQRKFLGQVGKSKSNLIDQTELFQQFRKQRTQMRIIDQINNIPDDSSIFTEDMSYIEVNSKLVDLVSNSQFKNSNQNFLVSKDDPYVVLGFQRIARLQQIKRINIDFIEQEIFEKSLKTYKTIKISELIPILMNKLGLNQYESLKLSRFLVEQSDEPSDQSEEDEQETNIIFDENRKVQAPLLSVRLMINSLYPQIFDDVQEQQAKFQFIKALKDNKFEFIKMIEQQAQLSEQNLVNYKQFQSIVKQQQNIQLDDKTTECCYILLCRAMPFEKIQYLQNQEIVKKLIGFEAKNINFILQHDIIEEKSQESKRSLLSYNSAQKPLLKLGGASQSSYNENSIPVTPVLGDKRKDQTNFSGAMPVKIKKTAKFQFSQNNSLRDNQLRSIDEQKKNSIATGNQSQSSYLSNEDFNKKEIKKDQFSFMQILKHQSTEKKIGEGLNLIQNKLYSLQDMQSNQSNIITSQNDSSETKIVTDQKIETQNQLNDIKEETQNEKNQMEDKNSDEQNQNENKYSESRSESDFDMQQSLRKNPDFKINYKFNKQNTMASQISSLHSPQYDFQDLQIIKKDFISQNENNSQDIADYPKSGQYITDQINNQEQNLHQAFQLMKIESKNDQSIQQENQMNNRGNQSPDFNELPSNFTNIESMRENTEYLLNQEEQKVNIEQNLVSFNRKDSDDQIQQNEKPTIFDKFKNNSYIDEKSFHFNHSFSGININKDEKKSIDLFQKDEFDQYQEIQQTQSQLEVEKKNQQEINTISFNESLSQFTDNNLSVPNEFEENIMKRNDSQIFDNFSIKIEDTPSIFNKNEDQNKLIETIQTESMNIVYENMFSQDKISELKQKLEEMIENKIDATIRVDINVNSIQRVVQNAVEVLCQIAINLIGTDSSRQSFTVRELLKGRIYSINELYLQEIQEQKNSSERRNYEMKKKSCNDLEVIRSADLIERFNWLVQGKDKIVNKVITQSQEECIKTIFQNQKCFDFIFLQELIQVFKILNISEMKPQNLPNLDFNELDMISIRLINRFLNYFVQQNNHSHDNPINFKEFMQEIVQKQNIKNKQQIIQIDVFQASNFFKKLFQNGLKNNSQIHENFCQFFAVNKKDKNIMMLNKFKKCLLCFKSNRFIQSIGLQKNKLLINEEFHENYKFLENSEIQYSKDHFLGYEAGPDSNNLESSIFHSKFSNTIGNDKDDNK